MVNDRANETRRAPGGAAPHMDAVATRIEKMRGVGLVAIENPSCGNDETEALAS